MSAIKDLLDELVVWTGKTLAGSELQRLAKVSQYLIAAREEFEALNGELVHKAAKIVSLEALVEGLTKEITAKDHHIEDLRLS